MKVCQADAHEKRSLFSLYPPIPAAKG